MMRTDRPKALALVALLATLSIPPTLQAQPYDDDDDILQTVARVAYLSGEVSYCRGDDPDDWQPASLNFPMTLGDRLYTARGSRAVIQTDGAAIYLAPGSDLAALNLTHEVTQLSLGIGSASFRIRRLGREESFEVDTPNAAITFDLPGDYRIDVDSRGSTRVRVNRGYAYVAAAGGEVPLEAGRLMAIDGIDSPVYDILSLPRRDSWDHWVESRARRFRGALSRGLVYAGISGLDDLDVYGRWSDLPEYGACWSPADVDADWQPYRAGRWVWQDPWGWTWISSEPWGWAPYHYGRWVRWRTRWYWVPVRADVRRVRYAPALVVFVGGPGVSFSFSRGGGYVGWFPLAPREPFNPWWGRRARDHGRGSGASVAYANRGHLTVVAQTTFTAGGPIARSAVRDPRVLREVAEAPVVRGPLSVVPVAASLRVSVDKTGPAPRPPADTLNRPVTTRLEPAPAPPRFRDKADIIRENLGAPVDRAQAERLSPESKPIRPIRSVVVETGRVTLERRDARGAAPEPVPVIRGAKAGQERREAPPAESRGDAGPAKGVPAPERRIDTLRPDENEARGKEEAERQRQLEARRQQAAEAARESQQQLESRRQQAEEARERQQQVETRKQEAERQRENEARRQQAEAEAAREVRQQLESRRQQAEEARERQQQVETRKREAEEARERQQQVETRRQEAEEARVRQQQVEARRQAAEEARLRQQREAEAAREAQPQPVDPPQKREMAPAPRREPAPNEKRAIQEEKPVQPKPPESRGKDGKGKGKESKDGKDQDEDGKKDKNRRIQDADKEACARPAVVPEDAVPVTRLAGDVREIADGEARVITRLGSRRLAVREEA